jgi:hypothetical protein
MIIAFFIGIDSKLITEQLTGQIIKSVSLL